MNIDPSIHDLLYDHDCVIVPRFGGLLVQYKGARIDEARKLVHPPGKEVGFNKQLTRNDGLLTDAVAKRDGVRFEEAAASIALQVDAWQSALGQGRRVELPRIGTFWIDASENLRFEPDPRSNFLKDAFGLRAVSAFPVARTFAPPALPGPTVRELKPAEIKESAPTRDRRAILWTASAAAAVLFAVATWLLAPAATDNGQQLGGWLSLLKKEPAAYVARTVLPSVLDTSGEQPLELPAEGTGVQSLDLDGTATLYLDMGAPAPSLPDTTHVAVAPEVAVATMRRYHVMGGCFAVRDNADNFIANMKSRGFDASIIDEHKGLWRVAIGSFADKALANEALAAARKAEAPEAWLLRK
ncbi:MAG: SPOR domain-containing protein [Flavobacteriales bacterium]